MGTQLFVIEIYSETRGRSVRTVKLFSQHGEDSITFGGLGMVGEAIDRLVGDFLERGETCQLTIKVRARLPEEK